MELAEDRQYLLEAFDHLSEKRQAEFLDFMRIMVKYPGFFKAFQELAPPDADPAPWEEVMALVREWMEKEKSGGAA